jgi:hypothetical protein
LEREIRELDRIAQSMITFAFDLVVPAYGIFQEYDHGERGDGNIASFIVE